VPGIPILHLEPLPSGGRVRLRLPHRTDAAGVLHLCARLGLDVGEVEAARLVRFDPRRQAVACAVTWEDGAERLVGLARMSYADGDGEPALLLADPACRGLDRLLARALRTQAAARARRAA
jgi:hypothetical protein